MLTPSWGIILDTFPGFHDYIGLDTLPSVAPSPCRWEAARGAALTLVVHFHKRAQIAVANLWAALGCRRHRRGIGGGPLSESGGSGGGRRQASGLPGGANVPV